MEESITEMHMNNFNTVEFGDREGSNDNAVENKNNNNILPEFDKDKPFHYISDIDSYKFVICTKQIWRFNGAKFACAIFSFLLLIYLGFLVKGSEFFRPPYRDPVLGTEIYNVWNPDNPSIVDWVRMMDMRKVDLAQHPAVLSKNDFKVGYFTSKIYNGYAMIEKNISFTILTEIMEGACPIDSCLCMSAFQIGIPANIILLNDKKSNKTDLFMEPTLEQESEKKFKAKHYMVISSRVFKREEDFVERPEWIIIDYHNKDGTKSRNNLKRTKAACVMQCIEINTKKYENEEL